MSFAIRYILRLIAINPAKIIMLFCSVGLFISLNYIDSRAETVYDIIFEFESNGRIYYIYKDDGLSKGWSYIKKDKDFRPGDKEGVMIENHLNVFYLLTIIALVICSLVLFLIPLDSYGGRWDLRDVYVDCLFKEIKVDKEGSKLYYHCRGRILKMIDTDEKRLYSNKGLNKNEVKSLLLTFSESPNLYEKYRGTKSDIRTNKINDIIDC